MGFRASSLWSSFVLVAACSGTDPHIGELDSGVGGNPNAGGSTTMGGALPTGGSPGTGGSSKAAGGNSTGGSAPSGGITGQGGSDSPGGTPSTGGSVATGGVLATGGNIGTGGLAATGGHLATGGTLATGGAATGGTPATGGAVTGGTPATGGAVTGGTPATGGAATGGTPATGGRLNTGGAVTGGTPATGGSPTGGMPATGGAATGGTPATGGAATGGTPATGGMPATGGALATGGTPATGGAAATGGDTSTGGATGTCSGPAGGTVPPEWTCEPCHYGTGDGCDCGCGAVDPDCGVNPTVNSCKTFLLPGSCVKPTTKFPYLNFAASSHNIGTCVTAPAGWTCAENIYQDNACDCGCGVPDPDCADFDPTDPSGSCDNCAQAGACDPSDFFCNEILSGDLSQCTLHPPQGWRCDPALYNNGKCDCGCGIQDSDCVGKPQGRAACETNCKGAGSCASQSTDTNACGLISDTDNSKCDAGTWTCSASAKADSKCDCGCGIPDTLGCTSSSIAACATCGSVGSCASNCQGLNPADNAVCN